MAQPPNNWFRQNLGRPLTSGGIRQSILTLTSTAVGGGLLTLPFAMRITGIGLGTLIIILGGLASIFSIEILLNATVETGSTTYGDLVEKKLRGYGVYFDVLLSIYGFGVQVAYLDLVSSFLAGSAGGSEGIFGLFFPSFMFLQNRITVIWLILFFIIPLSIPKNLSALKYCSIMAAISLIYTAAVIIVRLPRYSSPSVREDIEVVDLSWSFFQALGDFIFCFNCHLNVSPVAGELVTPTGRRIGKITNTSVVSQLVFYLLISICGYLSFAGNTNSNVLDNYGNTDIFAIISKIALTITLIFALPINLNPTLRAFLRVGDNIKTRYIESLMRRNQRQNQLVVIGGQYSVEGYGQGSVQEGSVQEMGVVVNSTTSTTSNHANNNNLIEYMNPQTGLIERVNRLDPRLRRRLFDYSLYRFLAAVFYTCSAAIVATFASDASQVIGLTSCLIGTLMMFVLPALFAMSDFQKNKYKIGFLMTFGVLNGAGAMVMILQIFGVLPPVPTTSGGSKNLTYGYGLGPKLLEPKVEAISPVENLQSYRSSLLEFATSIYWGSDVTSIYSGGMLGNSGESSK